MTSVSSLASLARSIPKWHPTLTKACRVIACPQEHPCPSTCRKCRTRHEGACRDGERVTPCLTCQIGELLPLAQSYTDPGDGLRSPNLEGGGSRSKGTHSMPTEDTALNHVTRSELSLDRVTGLLSDAEDALRKALSEVEE